MPLDLPYSQEPPFDAQRVHRWFAVEFNNLAWDLFEKQTLACDEIERMIHLAHTSRLHWSQVGKTVNDMRGELLIAHAYARSGLAEATQRHARKCLDLGKSCDGDLMPFDRALMYGVAAWGESLAGNEHAAEEFLQQSHAAAADMTDPDAQKIYDKYEKLYRQLAAC